MESSQPSKPDGQPITEAIAIMNSMLRTLADAGYPLGTLTEQVRRNYSLAALDITSGNQTQAAQLISIHRNTLARILRIER